MIYLMKLIISNEFTEITDDNQFLNNLADLNNVSNLINTEYICINVHLSFNNQKLSNNYGFDIAVELRTKFKVQAPIILYSPLPKSYFEALSKAQGKYKILFGSGSYFLQIPNTKNDVDKLLEKVKPLSVAALHDVSTMLCNLRGIVSDRLNHDLKIDADINEVFDKVLPFLNSIQKTELDIFSFKEKVESFQKSGNATKFNEEKEAFRRRFNTVFKVEETLEADTEETKYKILVLDDEKEVLDKLVLYLSKFEVVPCQKSSEAIKLLEADAKNEIVAVIADWRLYEDESKMYWQEKQGYDVVEFASKSGFRALFSLTSQDEFLVTQIRNISDTNFKVFKKENILDADRVAVMQDVIYEECKDITELISKIPAAKNWTSNKRSINKKEYEKLLKEGYKVFTKTEKSEVKYFKYFDSLNSQYIEKLKSKDKKIFFDTVDEKADVVWQYVLDYENVSKVYLGIEKLRPKFKLATPKDNLLFPTLVLRRIWIAFWLHNFIDFKSLSEDEKTEKSYLIFSYINKEGKSDDDRYKSGPNNEKNKLCINLNQIRNLKFLPEESAWFKKWDLI